MSATDPAATAHAATGVGPTKRLTERLPALDPRADPHHERRWLILLVVLIAQIMILLDATVVNVALPSALTCDILRPAMPRRGPAWPDIRRWVCRHERRSPITNPATGQHGMRSDTLSAHGGIVEAWPTDSRSPI
jgi:hypothetical protein